MHGQTAVESNSWCRFESVVFVSTSSPLSSHFSHFTKSATDGAELMELGFTTAPLGDCAAAAAAAASRSSQKIVETAKKKSIFYSAERCYIEGNEGEIDLQGNMLLCSCCLLQNC